MLAVDHIWIRGWAYSCWPVPYANIANHINQHFTYSWISKDCKYVTFVDFRLILDAQNEIKCLFVLQNRGFKLRYTENNIFKENKLQFWTNWMKYITNFLNLLKKLLFGYKIKNYGQIQKLVKHSNGVILGGLYHFP